VENKSYGYLIEMLRSVALRPTQQRLALMRLLYGAGDRHVSAEQLHDEAVQGGVKVSLATVYNTLNQLRDVHLLREIVVEQGRSYFDTNTSDHHHFYNETTGTLSDIPHMDVRVNALPDLPQGCVLSRVDVVVRVK
jgi:Fur family iron response transcriptional regulator